MAFDTKGQPVISPAKLLEQLTLEVLQTVKKARQHHQSLNSDNYYANKVLSLRAQAVNAFNDLSTQTAGDVTAMAEMIQAVFSPKTEKRKRSETAKELIFSLRTTWTTQHPTTTTSANDPLFPPTLIEQTKRGYLTIVCRQMNECYTAGWYDASAVMMRRLLEIVIIEAFEQLGQAAKIKDGSGNYLMLSDLITAALAEPALTLSRGAKTALPQMKDIGHRSAHGRYFTAQKDDINRVRDGARLVIEEFLHHAKLL